MKKLLNISLQNSLLLVFALFMASCGNDKKPGKTATSEQPAKTETYKQISPAFHADSAYYFVQKQVDFGPRVTNSEAHKKCGDWMVAELKKYTDNVIEQKTQISNFDGKKLNVRNIIGEFNPKAAKRILLCAHWDSRPYADQDEANSSKAVPGADDGASGVGVLLEVARVLKSNNPGIGIDIVFFDAEDLGKPEHRNSYCLGSQYWSKNLHRPGYKADFGILLDMVGSANAKFAWEQISVDAAQPVLKKVWDIGNALGYSAYFYYYQKGGIEDDHLYVNKNAGIPTIDIISYDAASGTNFPKHWHTVRDDMSVIDRNTLKAVGQTLLEVIFAEPK